jgi:peptidoglycan/xylan/chitin deacetylase (PgdA/CDA1 family)
MNPPERVTWKRVLKCGISLGVFALSAMKVFMLRLVGRTPKGSCVVLYYHSIPSEQRAAFARQLDLLLRHAKPIAVIGKVILSPGAHHIGVTFDDGLENFYEQALPELSSRKIPVTIFVILEAIGKAFGSPGQLEKVMSLEQLRALPEDLVTIGSHTLNHPFLPSMNEEDAWQELSASRSQLEIILNRKVQLFSFPFGGFTEELIQLARKAGYQRLFITLPAFAFADPDEFVVSRIRVDPTDWLLEYRLKLAGAYGWLSWAFALKRKLLFNPVAARMLGLKRYRKGPVIPQSAIRESGPQ